MPLELKIILAVINISNFSFFIMNSILFEIKNRLRLLHLTVLRNSMPLIARWHGVIESVGRMRKKYFNSLCIYNRRGKAFSAGQDLQKYYQNGPGMEKFYWNFIIRYNNIRKFNKPVVAAVNGVAAGAGANIALCCDVVVAASGSFVQAFSKIGLIPDSGGTFILPRLIGFQKA